jgi:hypothetical protein
MYSVYAKKVQIGENYNIILNNLWTQCILPFNSGELHKFMTKLGEQYFHTILTAIKLTVFN